MIFKIKCLLNVLILLTLVSFIPVPLVNLGEPVFANTSSQQQKKQCFKCKGSGKETYQRKCGACNGKGKKESSCNQCNGRGYNTTLRGQRNACGICKGTGKSYPNCGVCRGGKGYHDETRSCSSCKGKGFTT